MDGNSIEGEPQIRDQATIHFSNLLNSSSPPSSISDVVLFDMIGPSITVEDNISLFAIPSPSEIKEAAFSLIDLAPLVRMVSLVLSSPTAGTL